MIIPLNFTAAVSTVLFAAIGSEAIESIALRPMGGTEEAVTPSLDILVDDYTSEHPGLHRGLLRLSIRHDADLTDALTAATQLQAITDYLLTPTGRAALDTALAPYGIWLRVIHTHGPATITATEERTRTLEKSLPFWLQTIL